MSEEKQPAPKKERCSFWLTDEAHRLLQKRSKELGMTNSALVELLAVNCGRLRLVDIDGTVPEFTE